MAIDYKQGTIQGFLLLMACVAMLLMACVAIVIAYTLVTDEVFAESLVVAVACVLLTGALMVFFGRRITT